jgi:hypothetical protein
MGFSLQTPIAGQPDSTEDPKLASDMTTLQNWGNGNIDPADVKAAFAQSAGMNQAGQTVKGSSIIAASQSTGSTSFTTLGTPDQVTGIVLPSAGLIQVWYQATWQESVSSAASAAIFVGGNQLKTAGIPSPVVQSAGIGGTAAEPSPLATYGNGVISLGNINYTGDVTTGMAIGAGLSNQAGAPCNIFAAAGTYTISVQFKASSGTVTVSNRRLYALALSFS